MHSPARASRQGLWLSTALLLVIAFWIFRQWPGRGLWYDETVNGYFARQSWSAIWNWCTRIDNQVPLHFVLLKVWGGVAGTSEFALRAFSVLWAIMATAGVLALGKRAGGTWTAGLLSASVFALTQSFLYAAFEVRPYALALALYAWSSIFLWEIVKRYFNRSRPLDRRFAALLMGYWVLTLGVLYTHYTGFLALAPHAAYVLWKSLPRLTRRHLTISAQLAAGLVVGYLPWLVALAGRDVRAETAYAGRVTPVNALQTYLDFFAFGQKVVPPHAPPYAIGILIVAAAALAALTITRTFASRPLRDMGLPVLMMVIPICGLVLMVYGVQAKLSGRHAWPAWIGLALVIGGGLSALSHLAWWLRVPVWAAALWIVWLPASAHYQPIYNSYLREAFQYVNVHAEPGDVLILRDGTLFTAAGYYDAHLPWIGLPPDKLTDVTRTLFIDEAATAMQQIIDQNQAQRVWVLAWQGDIMDPQNLVGGILEYVGDSQPLPDAYGFGDVTVALYTLRARPDSLVNKVGALQPSAQFPPDGPIFLGGYVLGSDTVAHGASIALQAWWKRGSGTMPDARISVRLYDLDGNFYAQRDQPPVVATLEQTAWKADTPILGRYTIEVPPDMPSGPAEIKILLYDMRGSFEPIIVPVASLTIAP